MKKKGFFLIWGYMNIQPAIGDVRQAGRQKEKDGWKRKQVEGKVIFPSFNVAPHVNMSSQEVKPQGHRWTRNPPLGAGAIEFSPSLKYLFLMVVCLVVVHLQLGRLFLRCCFSPV